MSWYKKFIELAKFHASWSKDPSKKIGAVIVNMESKTVLSIGYNGFPRGISDTDERLNVRETKYKYVSHAEANSLYNAARNGIKTEGASIFVYGLPCCHECAKAIIQSGIKEVVYEETEDSTGQARWSESNDLAFSMFKECGIVVKNMKDIMIWE
jgi:dCMP deaminase